jgi:uncharacterized protein YegL
MAHNNKVASLNQAIQEMIRSFAELDSNRIEIHVAIITFGGITATLEQDLTPAQEIGLRPISAGGKTPMGAAFELARDLIEDEGKVPSRAYAPTVILVSDGEPTDHDWSSKLNDFISSPRASKAARFALAIGEDADQDMLKEFVSSSGKRVHTAAEASQILNFFERVTMSVVSRFHSHNPNIIEPTEDDEFDY